MRSAFKISSLLGALASSKLLSTSFQGALRLLSTDFSNCWIVSLDLAASVLAYSSANFTNSSLVESEILTVVLLLVVLLLMVVLLLTVVLLITWLTIV